MDSVEEYIDQFEGEVRERLRLIRQTVVDLVPSVDESMAYGMPAYKLHGKPLVYFAGYAKHVGFYATPNGHRAFASEFAKYKQGKGSVQFPNSQPLPVDLIKRVIEYRKKQVYNT